MAEIINLRLARKARKRADAVQTAAENRARFGRTKAERLKQDSDADRQARRLDGVRLDPGREN